MGMEKSFDNNAESIKENPVAKAEKFVAEIFENIGEEAVHRIGENPYFDDFSNRGI